MAHFYVCHVPYSRPPKHLKPAPTVADLLHHTSLPNQNGLSSKPPPVEEHTPPPGTPGTQAAPPVLSAMKPAATVGASNDSLKDFEVDASSTGQSLLTQAQYDSLFESVIKNSEDQESPKAPNVPQLGSTPTGEAIGTCPENAPKLPDSVTGSLLEAIVKIKQVRVQSLRQV